MASKVNFDGSKAQSTDEVDCTTLARMSLSEMLYHVLTGEGSPFHLASAAKAA